MAQRPRSENDIWHSLPRRDSSRSEGAWGQSEEYSAYQATTAIRSRSSTPADNSAQRYLNVPSISTTESSRNKALPSPPESDKKKRKPASPRSLIRRRPSEQLEVPEPHQQHQRSSSANDSLTVQSYQYYHPSTRSVPSSPANFAQASAPTSLGRSHSADITGAMPTQYTAYTPPGHYATYTPARASSTEPSLSTRRTFPETSLSPLTSDRQRPHTWLSPTEPFDDASQVHLFVEATSGLPDGGLGGFDSLSPTSPLRLQGSLFNSNSARSQQIPLPRQNQARTTYTRPPPQMPQQHPVSGWQAMGYDYVGGSSAQTERRGPPLNAINLELERLGLAEDDDVPPPEDELPDYAQSQAEMHARKRKEAAARARELEDRWNHARGRR